MAREIGILTASGKAGGLGGNRANFARVCREAERRGVDCAVFNVEPRGAVASYVWESDERAFRRLWRPLPTVLYNRIPLRAWEGRPATVGRFREWRAQGRTVTNPRFLEKAELGRLWTADDALRQYVPAQETWDAPGQLAEFAERHGSVYVKPLAGKAGVGIMRVRRRSGRGGAIYDAVIQQAGLTRTREGLPADELERRLWQPDRYLLQQEADCALFHGRKFDLRLLFHRAAHGVMSLTGTGVRVGTPGGITTHVPNGGMLASVADVLPAVFGKGSGRIGDAAERVAQQAATAVTALPGVWCELSLDVGLSPEGEPLLFEANAKPMKFDETWIEQRAKRRLIELLTAL